MEFNDFRKSFNTKLEILNITLSEEQYKQFYNYMNLLIEWNNKINLTAIIEPEDIILKHFIDSLTINKYIKKDEKIADIGTGAGFPGVPLKIVHEGNDIVLIDSLNKRVKFLDEVIKHINLKNVNTVHSRAEEIGHNKEYRNQFDIVTSRAVAKLNILVEYMMPLLKVGGRCICLKGPNIEEEINEAKNAIKILGGEIEKVENLVLPESDNKRTIVILRCIELTQKQFPRKPGRPSELPL